MKRALVICLLVLSSATSFALERGKEFRENILATCRVRADDGGTGTGFALSKRKILTAGHVIIDNKHVTVSFFDEKNQLKAEIRGKVVKAIEEGTYDNDLGVVELEEDAPYFNDVKLGETKLGDEGYTVGGPHAEIPHVVSVGTFSGMSGYWPVSMLSANSAPGASGSAVFNDKHELVGVLVSGIPNVCIYFITVERIKEVLK